MRAKPGSAGGADRLAPQAFFNGAFKMLGEAGHENLTVDSLCAQLNVTKGSFYHHFANTTEFVAGLLQCWEDTIDEYLQRSIAMDDLARQLEAVWPAHVNRPHEAEAALRSWGSSNPMVAAAVRRIDEKVEAASRDALAPIVPDPQRRRILVFMWMSMLAGMQQRPQPLDRELMLAATLEFLRNNMGIDIEADGETLRVLGMPNAGTG
jgi:AcrR family transcriptional regulator